MEDFFIVKIVGTSSDG